MKILFNKFLTGFQCAFLAAMMFFSSLAFAVPVNINKADAELIADSLSGIGMKTAEKIIQYRDENGQFKSVDDLLSINGIGEKKLSKIRADIKLKD